jgi:Mce-associated membrane protein
MAHEADHGAGEADQQDGESSAQVRTPAAPPLWRSWRLLVVVGLVLLLVLAGWRDVHVRRAEDAREQMVAAARAGLIALTTIDHQQADRDVQRILEASTGGFRDDFEQRAEGFKDAARKAESTSVGTVSESAIESSDRDEGRVLVALTVMTSNRGVPEQQPQAWRTRVTVTRTGDGFKVAAVEFVA